MFEVWVTPAHRLCHRPDLGHGRAVVLELAFQVPLLLLGARRRTSRAEFGIDVRDQRRNIVIRR